MSENCLFLSGEENKYSIVIASMVKYLEHSFFYIISYYDFKFSIIYQRVQFDSFLLSSAKRRTLRYDTCVFNVQ